MRGGHEGGLCRRGGSCDIREKGGRVIMILMAIDGGEQM